MAVRAIVIDDPDDTRTVHHAAETHIVGYAAPSDHYEASRHAHLTRLFAQHPAPTPTPTTVIAAVDEDTQQLVAGAILETPYTPEVTNLEVARSLAQGHRVLAGLFVTPHHRRTNIGRDLLCEAAGLATLDTGARYIDGFVDDRNDTVDFYRRIGAQVLPHNEPLPARNPANVTQLPYPGTNGHWFYLDLWDVFNGRLTCSRCDTALDYSPEEDTLDCPRCEPAPTT